MFYSSGVVRGVEALIVNEEGLGLVTVGTIPVTQDQGHLNTGRIENAETKKTEKRIKNIGGPLVSFCLILH